jgi:hypothetical protein
VLEEWSVLDASAARDVPLDPCTELAVYFDKTPCRFLRACAASVVRLSLHRPAHVENACSEVVVCHVEGAPFVRADAEAQGEKDSAPIVGDCGEMGTEKLFRPRRKSPSSARDALAVLTQAGSSLDAEADKPAQDDNAPTEAGACHSG